MILFVTIVVAEAPAVIIYSYMRDGNYVYLHVPTRLVKECGIASGARFWGFVRDGKLVIEQQEIFRLGVENAQKSLG